MVALKKMRSVLLAFDDDAFADDAAFEDLLEVQSLDGVLALLNEGNEGGESLPAKVFASMFSEEEWSELEASEQAIAEADEGKLRVLRLQRQYNLLWDAQSIAIDLTVRNEHVAGEQTDLVNKCTQVMNVVLDKMGMNQRGVGALVPAAAAVRNAARVVRNAPVRNAEVRNAPAGNAPIRNGRNQQTVAVKAKPKAKSPKKKAVKKVAKKREERSDEEEEEDVVEETSEKRAKTSSEDNKGEENDEQEDVDDKEDVDDEVPNGDEDEEDDAGSQLGSQEAAQEVQAEAPAQPVDEIEDMDMEMDYEEIEAIKQVSVDEVLENAKLDIVEVMKMLKERSKDRNLTLKVSNVCVPDARSASADSGSVILLDDAKLSLCLSEISTQDDWQAVERWGALLKWWRLVNRCFAITGIFAHLRAQKDLGGLNLKKRFAKEVDRLKKTRNAKGKKVWSYTQASAYDRLGRFLVKYPQFVYQMQLVSLADWDRVVGDEGKMITILENRLVHDEFWKRDAGFTEGEHVGAAAVVGAAASASAAAAIAIEAGECLVCQIPRVGPESELWQCSECGKMFHEMCALYESGTICADIVLANGTELETLVYCTGCLSKKDLTMEDVAKGIQEVKSVARFLNAAGCEFVLEKVAEDGFCCFRILENAARTLLGWKGAQAKFCRGVAIAALESAEAAAKEIGGVALEDEALQELRKLATVAKPVDSLKKGAWKRLEMQHILKGFVEMFPGKVVVNVYQASENGEVRKSTVYGGGGLEVNMLHWGMVQHYDCLVGK